MILSHKYRFIFIKTNKTAGTSIEIALSKFCGPDDVITPISPEDEELRKNLGYRAPQNFQYSIWDYSIRDLVTAVLRYKRKAKFYNHISVREVATQIEKKVWDSYYKFCFERNPWDRVVSLYYWKFKTEPRPTILEFVESSAPIILKRRGYELYTINGDIAVDKVCRYESLSEELEQIRDRLGFSDELELPRAKSRFREDKRSYRDILGEKEKAKIAELFRDEINLFGYNF
jgi:hypothetical protein